MRRAAALVALALAAAPAAAQTQGEMNAKAGGRQQRADGALNRQWGVTLAAMKRRDAANPGPGGFGNAAALLASQRAWLAFRDAQCAIEGGRYFGGTMQAMTRLDCLARLSQERTAQLKALDWQG